MATRPLYKRVGYNGLKFLFQLGSVLFFGMRVYGQKHAPKSGAALICSNHQSHFDPGLIGLSLPSRLNFLGRRTLFDTPLLKQIITFLDTIPIDREGSALAGMKETLKRLKQGEQVVIFPEGTRTSDGEVAPIKAGFTMLARRSDALIVPIGLDGAFQAWPRTRWYPWMDRIVLVVGEPITPAQFGGMSDEELVAEIEKRIRACHAQARRKRTKV
jgi:1-acyl-sn-glycerol-3-phosphate acyltransferase